MDAREHYNAMIKPFVDADIGQPDHGLIDVDYRKPASDIMAAAHLCAALDRVTAAIGGLGTADVLDENEKLRRHVIELENRVQSLGGKL